MSPKVFISHASEDKERFVLDFAIKLRSRGIDAWLDKWEMYPGDSLVDKIFEEGIKNAQAVIVVISKYSVNKPWVREELNASVVRKINGISKLIPVIIDDCKVPEALQNTVWSRITDLNHYDEEFERIVMAIYGQYDKPALGTPPSYAKTVLDTIPGLTKADSLIMKLICEKAIESGNMWINNLQISDILDDVKALGIPQGDFSDILKILSARGFLKVREQMGGEISIFQITVNGFEKYAKTYLNNYDNLVKKIISCIVNRDILNNKMIADDLNEKQVIVDHVLELLASRKLIRIAAFLGGSIDIYNISPELKRVL